MAKTTTKIKVRQMRDDDIAPIAKLYISAFSEPPWNEKWAINDVIRDITHARSQEHPIMLVAVSGDTPVGFTWGYSLRSRDFPFLEGQISARSMYVDEIAVCNEFRKQGLGTLLCTNLINMARHIDFEEVVLRTDLRNNSSMKLFSSLGFREIGISDPQYSSRIYLRKSFSGLLRE